MTTKLSKDDIERLAQQLSRAIRTEASADRPLRGYIDLPSWRAALDQLGDDEEGTSAVMNRMVAVIKEQHAIMRTEPPTGSKQ